MPKVELPYTEEGVKMAKELKPQAESVGGKLDFDTYDASQRSQSVEGYAYGGEVTPTYKAGGTVNVPHKKTPYERNNPPKDKKKPESLKERRERRIKEGKWVLGEQFTEAGRKRAQARKNKKKLDKLSKKGVKVTTTAKGLKDVKNLDTSGKIRNIKKVKEVEVTKGGAYPAYEKKSKPAKDFQQAFSAARKEKGAGKTFTWDGRSYSTNTADDLKKTDKK